MVIGSSHFDVGTWVREPRFTCWLQAGAGGRTGPGTHALSPALLKLTLHPASVVAWFVHSQEQQVSAQNVNRQGDVQERVAFSPLRSWCRIVVK